VSSKDDMRDSIAELGPEALERYDAAIDQMKADLRTPGFLGGQLAGLIPTAVEGPRYLIPADNFRAIPSTPAGRMAMVMELLAPTYIETCPHCGSEVEKRGEPLISPEDAFKLLAPEEDPCTGQT
jgi:hypothetical protein